MFGDVLTHSGCIRSRGPYCGMSYECVWVSSELILCQDPINGKPAQSSKKPDAKDKPKGPDLSDKLGKDGKLKGDKWERRIKEGLCLYCGKPGHIAADCNKAAVAKARASKVEPTESTISKK
jgi:hypothetical protein